MNKKIIFKNSKTIKFLEYFLVSLFKNNYDKRARILKSVELSDKKKVIVVALLG